MEWKYYNHAMIPDVAPHENVEIDATCENKLWKCQYNPLLIRWTTDYDIEKETNWWYVIKDTPFDIMAIKAKRRYEINKGNNNFYVREINQKDFIDSIYEIAVKAFSEYPSKYRPKIQENYKESITNWNYYKVYGAFLKENMQMCGYACLSDYGKCKEFNVLKVSPDMEKLGINAAIVSKILDDHSDFIENGGYISDGARNIRHETNFQNYLEKYFGFRKAFCRVHVRYNPKIKWIISLLYAFRKVLKKFDNVSLFNQINAVLKMEEIVRQEYSNDK